MRALGVIIFTCFPSEHWNFDLIVGSSNISIFFITDSLSFFLGRVHIPSPNSKNDNTGNDSNNDTSGSTSFDWIVCIEVCLRSFPSGFRGCEDSNVIGLFGFKVLAFVGKFVSFGCASCCLSSRTSSFGSDGVVISGSKLSKLSSSLFSGILGCLN